MGIEECFVEGMMNWRDGLDGNDDYNNGVNGFWFNEEVCNDFFVDIFLVCCCDYRDGLCNGMDDDFENDDVVYLVVEKVVCVEVDL